MLAQRHPQLQIIPEVELKRVIDRPQHLIHQIADLLADDQVPFGLLTAPYIDHHLLSFQVDGYVHNLTGRKFHLKLILDPAKYLFRHTVGFFIAHFLPVTFGHRHIMSPPHPQNGDLNMKDQVLKRHIRYIKIIFRQTSPHTLVDPLDLLGHILIPIQLLQQTYLLCHISGNAQTTVKLLALHPDAIVGFPFKAQVIFPQKTFHFLQIIGQRLLGNIKQFT